MKIVLDTSSLIQSQDYLEELIKDNELILVSVVADELDIQKEDKDNARRSYNGRHGLRFIEKYEDKLTYFVCDIAEGLPNGFDIYNNDNKIISMALKLDASIATLDRGMKIKALSLGINVIKLEEAKKDVNYKGYRYFEWDCQNEEVANLLNELANDETQNIFGLNINEFAVLKDTNRPIFDEDGITNDYEIQSILQWDGAKYTPLKYKNINNSFSGKVQPRNLEQKMLFSLMQNDNITIKLCSGGYGTGKDYCMLTNALDLIQKNKYEKIVWFRNAVQVKGIKETGFLPGTFMEKMSPYSAVLDDILGEQFGTEMFINNGKLEIGNLGAVRGRTFKDSIIFLTEMQNCSTEIIQLLISRIGEGSILVMNGDFRQIDDISNSAYTISEVIDTLHGQDKFGWINLEKVERSETANLAKLFDR